MGFLARLSATKGEWGPLRRTKAPVIGFRALPTLLPLETMDSIATNPQAKRSFNDATDPVELRPGLDFDPPTSQERARWRILVRSVLVPGMTGRRQSPPPPPAPAPTTPAPRTSRPRRRRSSSSAKSGGEDYPSDPDSAGPRGQTTVAANVQEPGTGIPGSLLTCSSPGLPAELNNKERVR